MIEKGKNLHQYIRKRSPLFKLKISITDAHALVTEGQMCIKKNTNVCISVLSLFRKYEVEMGHVGKFLFLK